MSTTALNEFIRTNAVPVSEESDETAFVYFFNVALLNPVTDDRREEFLSLIEDSVEGEFCSMSQEDLRKGPSYISLGAWLGDQSQALLFIGLLQLLRVGSVVTPRTLGITQEPQAQQLAGTGFVMGVLAGEKL